MKTHRPDQTLLPEHPVGRVFYLQFDDLFPNIDDAAGESYKSNQKKLIYTCNHISYGLNDLRLIDFFAWGDADGLKNVSHVIVVNKENIDRPGVLLGWTERGVSLFLRAQGQKHITHRDFLSINLKNPDDLKFSFTGNSRFMEHFKEK